jgi:hypothetical protein
MNHLETRQILSLSPGVTGLEAVISVSRESLRSVRETAVTPVTPGDPVTPETILEPCQRPRAREPGSHHAPWPAPVCCDHTHRLTHSLPALRTSGQRSLRSQVDTTISGHNRTNPAENKCSNRVTHPIGWPKPKERLATEPFPVACPSPQAHPRPSQAAETRATSKGPRAHFCLPGKCAIRNFQEK